MIGVICETCNDTHIMALGERVVPCTRCPLPCSDCRAFGTGAYCADVACECGCHVHAAAMDACAEMERQAAKVRE